MGKKRLSKKERAELDNERLKKILKDRNKINLAEQQLKRDKLNKQKENEAKEIEIENQRQIDKVLKLKEKEILRLEKVKIDSLPENIKVKCLNIGV